MRKYYLTSSLVAVAALCATTSVFAADYVPPPVEAPPLVYTWSGFYAGGNVGWIGSADDKIKNSATDTGVGGIGTALGAGLIPSSVNLGYSGILAGGQLGYNWQSGMWVFGVEGDFSWAFDADDKKRVGPNTGPGFATPITTAYRRELDWLATFRGRVGFTATPSLLIYGTGGLAIASTEIANQFICPTCVPPSGSQARTRHENEKTRIGWTAGAGLEWMFAPAWSLKAEYLYVDLGSHSSNVGYRYGGNVSKLRSTARDTEHVVRGGINFHF